MRLFPTSLVAAALALQAGSARGEEEEVFAIRPISADPTTCNLSLATTVSLPSIANDPFKWEGECVAVDGFLAGDALFAMQGDADQQGQRSNEQLSGRRVGIYAADQTLASTVEGSRAYTVVGIAGDCETLGGGAVMVFGYCHYTEGAFIIVAEIHRR